MTEQYKLDSIIEDFFIEHSEQDKYQKLISLLTTIEDFLDYQFFIPQDRCIDLLDIESEAIDITNEELEPYTTITRIMELYRDRVIEFLKCIGITVAEDIYFYQLQELIETLTLIINIEEDQADAILAELETDEDDTSILVNLINNYTEESYFTLVYRVQEDIIDKLIRYFKTKARFVSVDIDSTLITNLAVLLSKDELFGSSMLYNNTLQGTVRSASFTTLLPTLYAIMEKQKEKQYLIPYEIYITCLLAKIPKDKYIEEVIENIDLDLVSYLQDQDVQQNSIIESFKTLVSNTIGDLSNEEE